MGHRSFHPGSYTGHQSLPYPLDDSNTSPTGFLSNRRASQPMASVSISRGREIRFGSVDNIGLERGSPLLRVPSPGQPHQLPQFTPHASMPIGHTASMTYLPLPSDDSPNFGTMLPRRPSHVLSGNEIVFDSSSSPHYISSSSPIGTGNQGSQWSDQNPSQFPGDVRTVPQPLHREPPTEFVPTGQFEISPERLNQSFGNPSNQGRISDPEASRDPFL